jgi:geranylgeranyl diphosphate synthase type II
VSAVGSSARSASTVEDILEVYRRRTEAAARPYLTSHGVDGIVRERLYDLVGDYPGRGGKGIRPALCLATCAAFGGDPEDALLSAVALELLHNAFLVHDDIEDGSMLRRGLPTLHQRHGVPLALNTGDALAAFAQDALRDNRHHLGNRMAGAVADEFTGMIRRTLEGQAMELGWRRDNITDLTPEDYLDLVLRKTCWYTTVHPLRVGALIGSWGRADLERLVRFGFYLGAAFQITDDVLNLTARDGRYGKEPLGDLFEGKRTLMVIHLLRTADGPARAQMQDFLALDRDERTTEEVAGIHTLMIEHGCVEFATAFGAGIADSARAAAAEAFEGVPDSAERRFIDDLIGWMLTREA